MFTLRNGEFVFINDKKQLLLLERGTNHEAQIIYGGEVLAFACSEDENIMALALSSSSGENSSVIRLYAFANNELGDAICEVQSIKATQLLWAGIQYLVVCGFSNCTIYKWKNEKLSRFESDSATSAFLQGDRLALFYPDTQMIKFWNLDSNRIMDSVKLSARGRRLISTIGVGYFCFALFDDGSVQVYYVTKSNIKKLSFFERFFPVKQNEKVTYGTSSLSSSTTSPLLACALSSRKVLLGLRGKNKVHKLEYKNEKHLVDSMQEELQDPFALMSISRDGRRCLAVNTETGKYQTLVLSFSSVKNPHTETRYDKHSLNDSQAITTEASTSCVSRREEREEKKRNSVSSGVASNTASLVDTNNHNNTNNTNNNTHNTIHNNNNNTNNNIGKYPKISNETSPSEEGPNRKYINGITITTFGVVTVIVVGFLARRILSSSQKH